MVDAGSLAIGGVGVFGGTFDPVHVGHVLLAEQIYRDLGLTEMRLMPAHVSPLKQTGPELSSHRLEMARLAVQGSDLIIDDRELMRQGPSYTVDTLKSIKTELVQEGRGRTPLFFCMGMDSLLNLNKWHKWQDLFELAHVIVLARPGWSFNTAKIDKNLKKFLNSRHLPIALGENTTIIAPQLQASPFGRWFICEAELFDISSSRIRQRLLDGTAAEKIAELDPAVATYIDKQGLYRPTTNYE